jgi:hypothetical protein
MARYKSKPAEIDAVLFTGENIDEVQEFCLVDSPSFFQPVDEEDRADDPEIVAQVWDKLHSTWVGVKTGQYIIKGTKGEFYPCDPEVFNGKYEKI